MMRARVVRDSATRIVDLEVKADGPAWDLFDPEATWRKKPMTFRPDRVRLVLESGGARWPLKSIQVSGRLVLKSGRLSETIRESVTWQGMDGWRQRINAAPVWVQEIANHVREGITAFSWADKTSADEVQKL